jgi:6-phosphogluconolactonase (cycloisomerase 2 family)
VAHRVTSRPTRPGTYVFAEGQNNGVTVVFKIDRSTGVLTKTNVTLDTPAPVCIAFV